MNADVLLGQVKQWLQQGIPVSLEVTIDGEIYRVVYHQCEKKSVIPCQRVNIDFNPTLLFHDEWPHLLASQGFSICQCPFLDGF